MKTLVTTVACTLGLLWGGTASGGILYPIAPLGSTVELENRDFINSVAEQSPLAPPFTKVIGDNIGQHPGAFIIGHPEVGFYFVGVFRAEVDLTIPDNAVYLWETTFAPAAAGFVGPQIQLGYWDGTAFSGVGITQNAFYKPTGVVENSANNFPDPPFRKITSSVTYLKDLLQDGNGNQLDYSALTLNAVRIEAIPFAHNQVTAVAVKTVPEPASIAIWGIGALGMGLVVRRKNQITA